LKTVIERLRRPPLIGLPGLVAILLVAGAHAAFGQSYGPMKTEQAPETGVPPALRDITIEQRLNAQLPLDAVFTNEEQQTVPLGRYFGARPVILALVYYDCPMLCSQVLNGLVGSLKALRFDAGREFEVVALSFDARERQKPELAMAKKRRLLESYRRATAAQGWHLLMGDEANIKRVTEAAGFRFKWDAATGQFAHASGIMISTPGGRLSHYFYGIEYAPRDIRLGLVEAAEGRIGSPVDALLLYCYHYDPTAGRYSAVVINILRLAGIVFLALAAAFYLWIWRRGMRRRPAEETRGAV
jgi:protein SCO1